MLPVLHLPSDGRFFDFLSITPPCGFEEVGVVTTLAELAYGPNIPF